MAEHKHAAVLRAIADKGLGAAQWQDGKSLMGQWNDCTFMITPITHSFLAWRIKPEPKPDVVRYLWASPDSGWCTRVGNYTYPATTPPNLKIILDGETGKLKSAEVLP